MFAGFFGFDQLLKQKIVDLFALGGVEFLFDRPGGLLYFFFRVTPAFNNKAMKDVVVFCHRHTLLPCRFNKMDFVYNRLLTILIVTFL